MNQVLSLSVLQQKTLLNLPLVRYELPWRKVNPFTNENDKTNISLHVSLCWLK